MSITQRKIVNLPKIQEPDGNLTYIECGSQISFQIQRIFYLYDVPGGASRAGHAPKSCHQFLIAMSGSFDVKLDDGTDTQHYNLNRSHIGLYVSPLIWRNPEVAAVVVSNAALLGAGSLLNELIRLDYTDDRISRSALAFLMFSPVSFYFSSAYTESIFLVLAVGAFYAARTDRWLIACLCGMCLSATRNLGVIIALPLLVEFVWQRWDSQRGFKSLLHPKILLLG